MKNLAWFAVFALHCPGYWAKVGVGVDSSYLVDADQAPPGQPGSASVESASAQATA